jgi:DNA-binding transcriptional LysR family regulator
VYTIQYTTKKSVMQHDPNTRPAFPEPLNDRRNERAGDCRRRTQHNTPAFETGFVPELQRMQTNTVTLARASKYPLLTLPRKTATHEMLASAYGTQGLPFHPSFETHNAISVVALVKAGFGITFMPVGHAFHV